MSKDIIKGFNEEYQYGFSDDHKSIYETKKGLSEEIIKEISAIKKEPEWMLEFRLSSYEKFTNMKMPKWGPDLSSINFDDIIYYAKASEKVEKSWDDVPEDIKDTFDKLGIPEAEAKYLSGVSTQYDSEVVYENMLKEVEDKGIIFMDTDSALKKHPELFKKYFSKLVPASDNKFAALNSAVWSGGTFIYIPKNVKLDMPLQAYFRINTQDMGQFERTLIIVDEGADVHYVEGCTAPIYASDSLHAAVVEIFVHDNAKCRYSTIQNWSNNVLNLVTKRAKTDKNANMEWIDGNIGSRITMKYPAVILAGENSKATCISVAIAGDEKVIDSGAKMIHLGANTNSRIVSKSIAHDQGNATYRGLVRHMKNAYNAKSDIECDTILIGENSKSDTIPVNNIKNDSSQITHEATVSNIDEKQIFYLMSRGISKEEATQILIMGFIDEFVKELPMEYAVELNRLVSLEMEGSVG